MELFVDQADDNIGLQSTQTTSCNSSTRPSGAPRALTERPDAVSSSGLDGRWLVGLQLEFGVGMRTVIAHPDPEVACDFAFRSLFALATQAIMFGNTEATGHHLDRDTWIAETTNLHRLNTLVAGGVLERKPVEGGHHEYRLTEKGNDLYPVLVAIMQWGDKWESPDGPPMVLVHEGGHHTRPDLTCDHCGDEVTSQRTRISPGPGHQ